MRFNCGPSWSSRRVEAAKTRDATLAQWHPFFCLLPRRVGETCVWLETIARKGVKSSDWYDGSVYWTWEYRIPMATLVAEEYEESEVAGGVKA